MTNYREFTKGQKVRTIFGEIRTVLEQDGCVVLVEEEAFGHYHPSKLWPLVSDSNTILAEQIEASQYAMPSKK